jgi:hypothetical protein
MRYKTSIKFFLVHTKVIIFVKCSTACWQQQITGKKAYKSIEPSISTHQNNNGLIRHLFLRATCLLWISFVENCRVSVYTKNIKTIGTVHIMEIKWKHGFSTKFTLHIVGELVKLLYT